MFHCYTARPQGRWTRNTNHCAHRRRIHSHQKTHVHHVCICLGLNRRQLRCIIIDDAVVVHNIRASASALLPGERGAGEGAGSTFFWCHECHMEYTSEKVVWGVEERSQDKMMSSLPRLVFQIWRRLVLDLQTAII